jgi:membrane protease YdiL (CAAX protease family)
MTQIIIELFSAFLQLLVFTLIPFVVFLFRKDKSITFFNYIGLYRAPIKSILYALSVALLFVIAGIGLSYINISIKEAMIVPNSVTGKLRSMGFSNSSVLILFITALIKTSLSEEILFRGFMAKRLIQKFGFRYGNFFQAMIFGIIHLLLFWGLTKATLISLLFIFVISFLAGWGIGYIKEKYANGSIIPGWIAHGLGNSISYFIIAFVI